MKLHCNTIVIIGLIVAMFVYSSCRKEDSISGPQQVKIIDEVHPLLIPRTRFPLIPRTPPISPQQCIYSYQDIINVLGKPSATVRKVILADGTTIQPGGDVANITYEAFESAQTNSVFDSKLSIEWRWPGGNWQVSTADVWSLGCVYQQSGQPPYTNLIKDGSTIMVNTCFYWSTNLYTGEPIAYLIIQ